MITLANIRKAIYCLNKRLDLLEGGEYSNTVTELSNKVHALEPLLDDAIKVSLTASKDASSTEEQIKVKLVATCSVNATITIKRGIEVVATADNVKTLSAIHLFLPSTSTMLDTYTAEFKIGDLTKTATANVGAIFVVCGEDWNDAKSVSPDSEDSYAKTSPAGTYSVNVDKYITGGTTGPFHVYFIIPRSMNISGATMGGFEFLLENAVESTIGDGNINCKYYESSNDYPSGTLTIKIS